MTIGDRIKRLRKELGLSADELGTMIGKDRSTIYRYENGDISNTPIGIIPPLAKALKTTPQQLLGWDDKPAMYWIEPTLSEALSERAEQWFAFTDGCIWTEEEFELFAIQARYFKRIKDRETYRQHIDFLFSFYEHLK